ncbi:MAG: hypothetical protein KF678_13370 [Phycisphaeraceae bacterium]|nr:hypothetical protein [Phycisphaeraceae bacterium]
MKTMTRALLVAGVAAAGLGLGGCRGMKVDYVVEVRNMTGGTVQASVVHDHSERVVVAAGTNVFPNDRKQLSLPRRGRFERLELSVTAPNNPGVPARMPLSPGMTYVNVTRQGDEGPIRLELVR